VIACAGRPPSSALHATATIAPRSTSVGRSSATGLPRRPRCGPASYPRSHCRYCALLPPAEYIQDPPPAAAEVAHPASTFAQKRKALAEARGLCVVCRAIRVDSSSGTDCGASEFLVKWWTGDEARFRPQVPLEHPGHSEEITRQQTPWPSFMGLTRTRRGPIRLASTKGISAGSGPREVDPSPAATRQLCICQNRPILPTRCIRPTSSTAKHGVARKD
jgi:hypothetical protein